MAHFCPQSFETQLVPDKINPKQKVEDEVFCRQHRTMIVGLITDNISVVMLWISLKQRQLVVFEDWLIFDQYSAEGSFLMRI